MFNILISLFILTSVIFIPNIADNFWIPKSAIFLIGGFILLAYNFISRQEKISTFKNKWIGLILIYIILSFGWHFYRPLVMAGEGQKVLWNIWNFLPSLNVILAIFLIKDLVEYTDSLSRWVIMAKVLCWVCFGFSIYALLQFFGLDQIFTKDLKWINITKTTYMITFMGNSMHSANFIAMLSPLCLMFKDLRYKIIYLLAFITLILINSAISMFAFIMGFLIYLIFMKRFKMLTCVILWLSVIAVLIYKYHPQYFCFSGRFELWKLTLLDWKIKPLFGWGLGSILLRQIRDHTTSLALAVENDFLEILHNGGIFLFVLVCGYLLNLFKRIIMVKDTMLLAGYTIAFIVYLVLGMGSFLISIAPLALVGILYISALEAQL